MLGNTEDNNFSLERVLSSYVPTSSSWRKWSFGALSDQVKQIEALGIPVMVIDYNAENSRSTCRRYHRAGIRDGQ